MARLKKVILITLALVLACGLATSCAVPSAESPPSSTLTPPEAPSQPPEQQLPPASEYPADISGHITIADKVIVQGRTKKIERSAIGEDRVLWIVEVSVRNNGYNYPINSMWDRSIPMPKDITSNIIWSIMIDGKIWSGLEKLDLFVPPSMSVSKGQSGKTTFLFEAKDINPGDAEIRYAGEEPYSYGKLIGGDRVAVYDWDLKKAVPEVKDMSEAYAVPDAYGKTTTKQLRTIASWSGTESRAINFSTDKSPWVVNGSYQVVSTLGHNFDYIVFTEDEYKAGDDALKQYLGHELLVPTRSRAGENYLVKQSGKFVICIYASGVQWQLKVGVE